MADRDAGPIQRRRTRAALFAVLAATLPAASPTVRAQQVDVAASELAFVTRITGAPVEGRFTRWQAQLQFDPRQPSAAEVALRIDVTSARFAAAEVSAEAQRPAWFDAARFAEARFESTAVRPLGAGRFEISGGLTLKGRTREIAVPVTLAQTGRDGVASGSFTIRRLEHAIGDGEWSDAGLVAHEVQVRFRIVLRGLAAASGP
jgi:polyisoprenoid-binding protein YceI